MFINLYGEKRPKTVSANPRKRGSRSYVFDTTRRGARSDLEPFGSHVKMQTDLRLEMFS